jgi:hypothetical protein
MNINRILLFSVFLFLLTGCSSLMEGYKAIQGKNSRQQWVLDRLYEQPFTSSQINSSPDDALYKRVTVIRAKLAMERIESAEVASELSNLRSTLISRNPKWSQKVKDAILKGRVEKGMTMEQVKSSLGEATFVSEDSSKYMTEESYAIYEKHGTSRAEVNKMLSQNQIVNWAYEVSDSNYDYTFGEVSFTNGLVTTAGKFNVDKEKKS